MPIYDEMHMVNTVLNTYVVRNLLHLWLIFFAYMVGIKFMVHFFFYIYGVKCVETVKTCSFPT